MKTQQVTTLADLRERTSQHHHDFAILLGSGSAYSRKTIHHRNGHWAITNHIDETTQTLTDDELWTASNIGQALDQGALVAIPPRVIR